MACCWRCVWSVVGCPDLQTNADVDVRYSADRSVAAVTCRRPQLDSAAAGGEGTTAASWRLACSDRGWHGYIGNCTAGSALLGTSNCRVKSRGSWNGIRTKVHRTKDKGKEEYLYSAFYILCISQSAQAWITQFYLQIHHAYLSFVCVHQMAPPLTEVRDI